ncbi:peptidase C14, caspase catalytic subunit p20 [Nostoc piscinale CENA21]|uniref:Peptidase C14, caspase catalytic subunit p20 n=1 Tax=Nostoc piscinale CENA21 TaxID=224013 RepID=A0A0M5MG55_9NOSO|nr:caspase family protein [Nostoc piscinale]ALF52418.1 peptidase C14, caspase catalytic subunit p20 [Nostoc piscinale CENA21]
MSNIKRRHFLQFSAATFAALGLSQWDIMQQGNNLGKVLAQNTGRKLALLVGINEYSEDDGLSPLFGCVTDVRLQQELLIHRFGFKPQDILTLTDKQATRQGILTAFEEHLIKQAKPSDVVLFHFSGHGTRVKDPDSDAPDGLNSTFIPIDGKLPPNGRGSVNHIMGHTLFLLMSALKTENVTVVLDSCHSGGGKRGNLRVRSVNGGTSLQPSPEELEYQRQWLKRLGLSPQEFIQKRRQAVAKGVVIASARSDQFAADAPFEGFHAGAFTYLLTQYLWQQTGNESVNSAIANIGRSTKILARENGNLQDPEFELNLSRNKNNPPIYFIPIQAVPAEAVVTQVKGNQVQLWLGGIDPQSLEAFTDNPLFSVVNPQGDEVALIKLESRQGLIGKGTLVNTGTRQPLKLKPGALLQERIRSIPNNPTLKIGIDESLNNNNAQQAIKALKSLKRVEPQLLGKQAVQYILGQMTQPKYQELQKKGISQLPEVGSFGIFLPSQDEIIPKSFGQAGESVTEAVKRLQPKFKSLLAARVVKQILGNINSSRINVAVSMNVADSNELLAESFPVRGSISKQPKPPKAAIKLSNSGLTQLAVGTKIAFKIQNNENQPIYVSILVIDAEGEMTVIFPNNWSATQNAALVEAQKTKLIPQTDDEFILAVDRPLGISEALIIASTTPLRNSLLALQKIASLRNVANRSTPIAVTDEILDVTNNILDDLDAGTRGGISAQQVQLPSGVRGIDSKKLAAMSISFEVVDSKNN